ncbi:MAG: hypothetical protein H6581_16670 [Bacteroidia bacterium]|nr:hypothetical protein [Bacteroidia bacterium]
MDKRSARAQALFEKSDRRLKKEFEKTARQNSLAICIEDLFCGSFPDGNIAMTGIALPDGVPANGKTRTLFAYLNLPGSKFPPGYYLIEFLTKGGQVQPEAQLLDLKGNMVTTLQYQADGKAGGGTEKEVKIDSIDVHYQPNGNKVIFVDGRVRVDDEWVHFFLYLK